MKKFSFLMALVLGFALNALAINPYAYGVSAVEAADGIAVTYSLNAAAQAVQLQFCQNDEVKATVALTAVAAGAHSETVAAPAGLAAGNYTLKVAVTGAAHDFEATAIEGKSFTGRIHATVDPYPTSPNFGNIYVTSRDGNERGMFFITPDYTYESTEVERFGMANADWGSCQRGAVAPNGEMWYSSWSDGNSGIHRHDHSAATPAITQFFLGTRASSGLFTNDGVETGCSTPGIAIYEDGANTKLYMVAEDFSDGNTNGSLAIYNIGQADGSIVTSWGVAPSAHYNTITDAANTNFCVAPTPYGVWLAQHRAAGSNNAGARSLQFVGNDGVQKYISSEDPAVINGSMGAGVLASHDGSKLYLVNGNGNLMQISIVWTDGTPALTVDTVYTTPYNAISQMTFDYAGNIVASVDATGSYTSSTTGSAVAVITLPAAEAPVVATPIAGEFTLAGGAPVADGPYTLTFNKNGFTSASSDDSKSFSLDANADVTKFVIVENVATVFATNADKVASIDSVSRVYAARVTDAGVDCGVKFGSSSATGAIRFTLANPTEVDSIVISAAMYGATEGNGYTVNGEAVALSAGNKVFENYAWTPTGVVSTITIEQNPTPAKNRFYLYSITVYPKSGNQEPPVVTDAPNVAAPAPTVPAAQVKSLYSDAYDFAPASLNSYNEGWWDNPALSEGAISGDHYLLYTMNHPAGMIGWQFGEIACVNMEKIHIDIFPSADGTIDFCPLAFGETTAGSLKTLTVTAGHWNSFDLDLSEFGDAFVAQLGRVAQVEFMNYASSQTWFAVDNVYLYTTQAPTVDTEAPTALTASLVSASYFSAELTATASDNSGIVVYSVYEGENLLATRTAAADVATALTVQGLTPGTAHTFIVKVADETGNQGTPVEVVATTLAAPAPAAAPTRAAEDVKAIYSDVYTPITFFGIGSWGQSTVVTEGNLAENDHAYLCTNSNYLGWEMNNNQTIGDLTEFSHFHMDVYVEAAATIGFTPIWGGEAEKAYSLVAGWNAIDIDLVADFAGINLANIYQLKWANMPATCFIDNVYFYAETAEPTIDHMWIIGNCATAEWLPGASKEMTKTAEGVFEVEETMTGTWCAFVYSIENCTATTTDWDVINAHRFGSDPSGAKLNEGEAVAITGVNGDFSFQVPAAGNYKFVVDLNAMTVTATSVQSALNDVDASAMATKVVENGHVYIIKNGVRYTITGSVVE